MGREKSRKMIMTVMTREMQGKPRARDRCLAAATRVKHIPREVQETHHQADAVRLLEGVAGDPQSAVHGVRGLEVGLLTCTVVIGVIVVRRST